MSEAVSDDVGARSPARRARPVWAVLLGALALVLLGAIAVLGLQVRADGSAQHARTQATEAAEQLAVDVTSVSSSNAGAATAAVLDAATGNFRTAYQQQVASLQQTVRDQDVTATSRVVDSGVVESRAGSAVVVVVVEATIGNRAQPTPTARRYRMQLGLQRAGGRWLTSSFEMVG